MTSLPLHLQDDSNPGFGSLQETMYGRLMTSAVKKRSVSVPALNAVSFTRGICRQQLPLAASSFEGTNMKRETSLFLTLGLLSAIAPPIFAQDLQGQPDPVPPPSIIGPQLIAWSELKKPQPIMQPKPASLDVKPSNQKAEPQVQQPQDQAPPTGNEGKKQQR